MAGSNEVKFEIVERIGALDAPNDNGWTREKRTSRDSLTTETTEDNSIFRSN